MSPFSTRLGAVAGWLALLGLVVGVIGLPAIIAGQEPSSAAAAELRAYFAHPELALINGYVYGYVAVLSVVFALGLRVSLAGGSDRDRAFADAGVALLIVAMVLNLVAGAIVSALASVASGDGNVLATLARLHDVTYDGLGDVLEGAWIGAFSAAMLGGAMPRWFGWYGIALAIGHLGKALGPFVGLPETIDAAFGILIVVWFVGTVVGLTRIAFGPRYSRTPAVVTA